MKVRITHWYRSIVPPEFKDRVELIVNSDPKNEWESGWLEISPEEIVELTKRYDVMLVTCSGGETNLYLDDIGRRFRQR